MRCKECGSRVFSVTVSLITEYHDARVNFKGVLASDKFEEHPGTREISGSYYLWEATFKCSKCGAQKTLPGHKMPSVISSLIENYARENVFRSD